LEARRSAVQKYRISISGKNGVCHDGLIQLVNNVGCVQRSGTHH
jgi:hypothetical protein